MDTNRREFLKSSSLLTGGALLSSLPFSSYGYHMSNEDTIKIALIGCGGRGSGAAAQALSTKQNVKLVAMADAFQDRLDDAYNALTKRKYKNDAGGEIDVKSKIDVPKERMFVRRLANATFGSYSHVSWDFLLDDYDRIRESIERTIPGFEDYNQRVRQLGGFYLPNGPREGTFKTSTKKANFTINKYTNFELKEGEYVMMTIRSHDQFNTTIYGLDDRYRGIFNERRVILMNPTDIEKAGLIAGDKVDLLNFFGGEKRTAPNFVVVPYSIPEHCVATYFPEANTLVPIDSYADRSMTPTSKAVIIEIERQVVA